jgi:hypothetical protein
MGIEAYAAAGAVDIMGARLARFISEAAGAAQAAWDVVGSFLAINEAMGNAVADLPENNRSLKPERTTGGGRAIGPQLNTPWMHSAADTFAEAKRKADALARSLAGGGGSIGLAGGAAAAQRELDKLNSQLLSLVNQQLSLDAGINADDLLPRPDAVNENARRLADIAVNGFKGQDWLGEFASEVPDIFKMLSESGDPKGAAARLLKDFQDGLVPELIDKETAKERVRRIMLGQETMANLASEIAGELSAEMGTALSSTQDVANQALGLKGKAEITIMDGGQTGGEFVDGLTAAILSRKAQMEASGSVAGASWGTGFMGAVEGNVPAALITILSVLVTPEVLKRINQETGRRGAT